MLKGREKLFLSTSFYCSSFLRFFLFFTTSFFLFSTSFFFFSFLHLFFLFLSTSFFFFSFLHLFFFFSFLHLFFSFPFYIFFSLPPPLLFLATLFLYLPCWQMNKLAEATTLIQVYKSDSYVFQHHVLRTPIATFYV